MVKLILLFTEFCKYVLGSDYAHCKLEYGVKPHKNEQDKLLCNTDRTDKNIIQLLTNEASDMM